jgi:hypothetical protein
MMRQMKCLQTRIASDLLILIKREVWCIIACIALSCTLVGCRVVHSRSELIGIYELNAKEARIILELRPDGTFLETITLSGNVEKRVGKWQWAQTRVGFDGLWIPEVFAPDYIRRADARGHVGEAKYTESGYWSISAENHWGQTVLPIFPDSDIQFNRVQSLK